MKGLAAGKPGESIFSEFPMPELEKGDLMVKPLACGICSTDVKMVKRGSKGEIKYALGHELSAEIVAVSEYEKKWEVGQRIIATPYLPCGTCYYCQHNQPTLCIHLYEETLIPGGLAEKVKIPRILAARGTFPIPKGMGAEVAALAEPFGCVIQGIEDAGLETGDSVLVIGDGPIGMITSMVSKYYGAGLVIVAGMTPHRMEIFREQHADLVVDVTQKDLRREVEKVTHGRGADIVMSTVSSAEALETGIKCVRPGGAVNAFAGVPDGTKIELDLRKLHYEQFTLTGSFGVGTHHLYKAMVMFKSGRIKVGDVITARFPFEKADEAIAYVRDRVGLKATVIF